LGRMTGARYQIATASHARTATIKPSRSRPPNISNTNIRTPRSPFTIARPATRSPSRPCRPVACHDACPPPYRLCRRRAPSGRLRVYDGRTVGRILRLRSTDRELWQQIGRLPSFSTPSAGRTVVAAILLDLPGAQTRETVLINRILPREKFLDC
jgi:hypothetical protein